MLTLDEGDPKTFSPVAGAVEGQSMFPRYDEEAKNTPSVGSAFERSSIEATGYARKGASRSAVDDEKLDADP